MDCFINVYLSNELNCSDLNELKRMHHKEFDSVYRKLLDFGIEIIKREI